MKALTWHGKNDIRCEGVPDSRTEHPRDAIIKVTACAICDPAELARVGFDAMMKGDADVVSGWKNKLQSAIANVTPSSMLAEQHRKMAEPGSGKSKNQALLSPSCGRGVKVRPGRIVTGLMPSDEVIRG